MNSNAVISCCWTLGSTTEDPFLLSLLFLIKSKEVKVFPTKIRHFTTRNFACSWFCNTADPQSKASGIAKSKFSVAWLWKQDGKEESPHPWCSASQKHHLSPGLKEITIPCYWP